MGNSTNSPKRRKGDILEAARKYKAKNKIPLLVHATRRWGRKINGRILYYGPVDGKLPDFGASNAIEEYHRVVEDDRAGRARRPKDSELITLQDATNLFLTAKAALRDTGELAPEHGAITTQHAAASLIFWASTGPWPTWTPPTSENCGRHLQRGGGRFRLQPT